MDFNSISFWILLCISIPLYYSIPFKNRWVLLLIISIIFYVFNGVLFTVVLFVAILTDYYIAILISRFRSQKRKILVTGIAISVGVLLCFKYVPLFNELSEYFFNIKFPNTLYLSGYLIPLGISFYTFKKISYVFDVYHGRIEPEYHFGKFALFISFFPEILSGPIDRAKDLLPQFKKDVSVDYNKITEGLRLILYGLFKKIVIADRLAMMVNEVYNHTYSYHGFSLILATYFFAFQIYADFSGYTDIAIGIAKLFGIDIPENFNKPYLSKSIQEFWRRWHITLSMWLRDYIFLPLAYIFSRKFQSLKIIKTESASYIASIMITWLIGGFWHGSKSTFIVWGLLQGIFLSTSFITRRARKKINSAFIKKYKLIKTANLLKIIFTFHIVAFAWIFFRAENINSALYVITNCFRDFNFSLANIVVGFTRTDLIVAVAGILIMIFADSVPDKLNSWFEKKSGVFRWAIYYFLLLSIIFVGIYQHTSFIYLKF